MDGPPAPLAAACLLLLAACPGNAPAPGSQGGPCYENRTCNPGLVCRNGLCFADLTRLDGRLASDWSGGSGEGRPRRVDFGHPPDLPPVPWLGTVTGELPTMRAAGLATRGDELLLVGHGAGLVMAKLQGNGSLAWARSVATGSGGSVALAEPGGFLIAGHAASKIWLLRVESDGQVTWQRTYADSGKERNYAARVLAASDGGFVVVGNSYASAEWDARKVLVFKVDATGIVKWQARLEGSGDLGVRGGTLLSDGGVAVVGTHDDGSDMAVFLSKLGSTGNLVWTRRLNGAAWDLGSDVVETPDKQLAVLGSTRSWGSGENDLWLLRLTASGELVSQQVYGGTGNDTGARLFAVTGGLLLFGGTSSSGATVVDMFAGKVSSSGALTWQKRLGESAWDYEADAALTAGEGLAVLADTKVGSGPFHFLAAVLGPDGETPAGCSLVATTSMVRKSSAGQVSNLSLTAVSTTITTAEVSAKPEDLALQAEVKCH